MHKFIRAFLLAAILLSASQYAHAQRIPVAGEVTRSGDTWTAEVGANQVYQGGDMIHAIQAAMDNLPSGRTSKHTVNVRDSGSTGVHHWDGDVKRIEMRGQTVLDFHDNTMHVNDTEDNIIVPIRAREADNIEIRNMRITGNPRYGMWFFGCENVTLSNIALDIRETRDANGPGLGVRFEARGGQTSGRWNRNVEIDHITVEGAKGHAVEFWGTDGLNIGTVETRDTGGAGLLINNSRNVHVGLVDAYRANFGGGYAGFRTANNAGPNIVVDKVIAVECGRGVFTVSGSHGITIHEVDIRDASGHGMFIENTQDFTVNGGTISNTGSEGVRLASRSDQQLHATQNINIRNLRVFGCPWGIRETLPRTNNNRFFNNDLRGNGNCLSYEGAGSVAAHNTCVRTPSDDLYEAWVARSAPTHNEQDTLPEQDFRGEGVSNLLRYALNIDNDEPAAAQLPRAVEQDGRMTLEFVRNTIKNDIAYIVEASSNLLDWDELLFDSREQTGSNNHGAYMRVADSIDLAEANGPRFLRLRIEMID